MAYELRLVQPTFDSDLTKTIFDLNHLRKRILLGTARPWYFFQLKQVFHWMESLGSARIEGNRTTISEYVEHQIAGDTKATESIVEIDNVTRAMEYVENTILTGSDISHRLIRDIHTMIVSGLTSEGDPTPGAYRNKNVTITGSKHTPPDHLHVPELMDELLTFINKADPEQFDLIKVALFHHRFTWVHPFNNGNGRVVRMLTYALLIKYGFNVAEGRILNPSSVFFSNRDLYYKYLAVGDQGTDQALLMWCDYVMTGIWKEIVHIDSLLNYSYLSKKILRPTIQYAVDKKIINRDEAEILKLGIRDESTQFFRASDISNKFTSRQKTHIIKKLKDDGFIMSVTPNSRRYCVKFAGGPLTRGAIKCLEDNNFIPANLEKAKD